MHPDLLYQLSLTMVPNIGPVQAKILLQHCEAEEIFHAKKSFLEKIEGIGPVRADSIKKFDGFYRAEDEIKFIEKYRIKPLFLTDEAYPKRLLNCYDSPTLLYYRGDADLNAPKIIAIIGTRSHTDYAKQATEKIIKELAGLNVAVISGLAYGVDAIAHKAALKNNLPTVGVLAHGLDHIYPPEHTHLAKEMVKNNGGLLTEFRSNTKPDKHNFPTRNRIVAGMSDATLVIETGLKGGSMITAELANGYNKDVFALPGKITDAKSAGCNFLIKNNKAILLTDAQEIIDVMGWEEKKNRKNEKKNQRELFIELTADEKIIVDILKEKASVPIDEINSKSGLSSSAVAGAILNLELQSVVLSLPGKLYRLA
ncbi:MAG: DNA-protecting protein DprA [Chitinophagaceae bacterium]|nr:DNA-protecting protein DprA [Chitinophagaceae bacterium]